MGCPNRSFTLVRTSRYGKRRLDHHDVGPFVDVDLHFAHRLFDVGRIELMTATIAELRCRIRRIAERTVEAGTVLRRIRHDGRLLVSSLVERPSDGGDAAIHHVRRRDDVSASHRVRERCLCQVHHRDVVDDVLSLDDPAMAMRRVFAQANVGDDDQVL